VILPAIRHWSAGLIAIACAALSLLPACENDSQPGVGGTRYRRIPTGAGYIAFIGAGQDDPLWPVLRAGAERFEREQGLIEVRYAAPPIVSPDQQATLIRSLTTPTLRGLCVQVIDPDSLGPVLDRARQNGAAIVTMGRRANYSPIHGNVGYDEEAIGRALADATVRYLKSRGAIMILHEGQKDRPMRRRYGAFMEAIEPVLGIERWAEIDCQGDPYRAREEIRARSERFPGLSAWVSLAPWPLLAWSPSSATASAPASPLPDGCKLITCGAEPTVWPFLESGLCPIVVGFDYHDMGAKALQFCQAATEGGVITPREYTVPVRMVTPTNLAEYKRDWAVWAAPPAPAP
jgi:ABC-type sugar transport system substrate-binding protein